MNYIFPGQRCNYVPPSRCCIKFIIFPPPPPPPPPTESTNNVFDVAVDVGVSEVICQFLRGPVASATCTIDYGTNRTNLNLTDTNTNTNTNVTNVRIPLTTASLQRDTLYHYVVSTMGVRMQGTFRTSMWCLGKL